MLPFRGNSTAEDVDLNDKPGLVMLSGGLYEDLGFSKPSGPRKRAFFVGGSMSTQSEVVGSIVIYLCEVGLLRYQRRDSGSATVVDLRGGTQISSTVYLIYVQWCASAGFTSASKNVKNASAPCPNSPAELVAADSPVVVGSAAS